MANPFADLVASDVWSLPVGTRIVWVTFLAHRNRSGIVKADATWVSKRANLDRETTAESIEQLVGRGKLEVRPGGWKVIDTDQPSASSVKQARDVVDAYIATLKEITGVEVPATRSLYVVARGLVSSLGADNAKRLAAIYPRLNDQWLRERGYPLQLMGARVAAVLMLERELKSRPIVGDPNS